jgi:hypothetical protein
MMFAQIKSFIGSMMKKPGKAADGRTYEANGVNGHKTDIKHDLAHLGVKNTKTVVSAVATLASGEPLDDKDLLLEHGVSMLQELPLNSGLSEKVSDSFIQVSSYCPFTIDLTYMGRCFGTTCRILLRR